MSLENLADKGPWKVAGGKWKIKGNRLNQTDDSVISRVYQTTGHTNYIATFKVKLIQPGQGKNGEAKFIFSDANKGEEYRIDFMYGHDFCRIYFGKSYTYTALKLIYGKEYLIRVDIKDNFLTI